MGIALPLELSVWLADSRLAGIERLSSVRYPRNEVFELAVSELAHIVPEYSLFVLFAFEADELRVAC